MFFFTRCVISITLFIFLSDKKRWREILPVGIFASYLGVISDVFMTYYKLWDYHGAHPLAIAIANNLVCYIIVTYLFIQWLPKNKTTLNMLLYWFAWTGFAITLEWLHLALGYMTHHQWWKLWHSYIADWILFYIFYKYYKLFNFEKLRGI